MFLFVGLYDIFVMMSSAVTSVSLSQSSWKFSTSTILNVLLLPATLSRSWVQMSSVVLYWHWCGESWITSCLIFADIWSSSYIYTVLFLCLQTTCSILCMQENSTLWDDYVCPLLCHLNSSTWKPLGRLWWNFIFMLCSWRSLKIDLMVLNLKSAHGWTHDHPIILYCFKCKMHIFSRWKIEVHLKFEKLFTSLQTVHTVAWKNLI
jgi:hypothetical protein